MGVDISYLAIPDDSPILRRAIADPEYGSHLIWISSVLEVDEKGTHPIDGPRWLDRTLTAYPALEEFVRDVERLKRERPGIERRILDLSREWDVVTYLLSEYYRTEWDVSLFTDGKRWIEVEQQFEWRDYRNNQPEMDAGWDAVRGRVELPPHLNGGQGYAKRYNPPGIVRDCAEYLSLIERRDLEDSYDYLVHVGAPVYKFPGGYVDREGTLDSLYGEILQLRDLYLAASEHGEGVLVFLV